MHSDVSSTDESHGKRNDWPSMKLLFGIWGCLGLTFVWLAWSTHHTLLRAQHPQLIWSCVATTVALIAWLGIWHTLACRRHHRRWLSAMQRSDSEHTERDLPENEAQYWELFENASDFVYTLDMQGQFTNSNKTDEHILGYARAELASM